MFRRAAHLRNRKRVRTASLSRFGGCHSITGVSVFKWHSFRQHEETSYQPINIALILQGRGQGRHAIKIESTAPTCNNSYLFVTRRATSRSSTPRDPCLETPPALLDSKRLKGELAPRGWRNRHNHHNFGYILYRTLSLWTLDQREG